MIARSERLSRAQAANSLRARGGLPIVVAMQVNGSTRVFMILGDPVAQVRAPELFNPLFRRHGVDAVLVPARVAPAELAGFVRHVLRAHNIDGLWLTIPHKSALFALLDRCDPLGTVAQAVNAARRNADGHLEGALFDGIGFVKALDHFGVAARGARALVVGAGGAGVAIAVSLAQRGVNSLALYDVDPTRCTGVAARIRAAWPSVAVTVAASADPAGHDLVVQASPMGLKPGDPMPLDASRVEAGATVVDILMKNQPTPLLQACAARGARVFPGYEMMIQQAPEYLAFFGLQALANAVREDPAEVRHFFQRQ
jgi:shikimate dehydrogenase